MMAKLSSSSSAFLLTRPMRGATIRLTADSDGSFLISTHTPHAGRDIAPADKDSGISTHTPHAGRDERKFEDDQISTHTPHAGRDHDKSLIAGLRYFYSHAPCGARHESVFDRDVWSFLLTRPMRGATSDHAHHTIHRPEHFYSHAPCGARLSAISPKFLLTRPMRGCEYLTQFYFYSHAPCGARPMKLTFRRALIQISTHTPHAGRD